MPPWWELVRDIAGIVLLLILLLGIALVVRRRALEREGGTFELSYRVPSSKAGRGWLLGIGRYQDKDLQWFRLFSLSPVPKRCWDRADLEYAGQRQPSGAEQISLFADHVVVSCSTGGDTIEMAMSTGSLTGFQAWLEAMPPGSRGVRPGDSPTSM